MYISSNYDLPQAEVVQVEQIERLCAVRAKMDKDEKLVRKALVKAWTKILEKYSQPGAHIPSAEEIYHELFGKGVEAGVKAVVKAHWFVFSDMVRAEIEEEVAKGLRGLDLNQIISDVRLAQTDPGMLDFLKEEIKRYVLFP